MLWPVARIALSPAFVLAGWSVLAMADVTSATSPTSVPPHVVASVDSSPLLQVDYATHTVHLRLVAAATASGMLNFNGGTEGRHTVTVPRGWTVRALVINRDPEVQHSAIVIRRAASLPLTPRSPAFPGGRTRRLMPGIPTGGRDTLTFVASRAGRYRIACGMSGHSQAGMWIWLVVTRSDRMPTYRLH
jgi:hypothetical protein